MQKTLLFIFFVLITFSGFSADSSNDDNTSFNKAFNFTVGVDLSVSGQYETLIYTDYYMDFHYNIFGDRLTKVRGFADFDAISIGLPISFLFYINPYFALGFSLNISIMNIKIFRYINNSNSNEKFFNLLFANSYKLLFKIKTGSKKNRIKFILEIGPEIYFDLWKIEHNDEIDESKGYIILSGAYLLIGFEFCKDNFSFETGAFIEGLFGSVYIKFNIHYERKEDQYILKFGTSIRIGYSYIKKID